MNYRTEIDGLRALAVLPVILFHAGFELFSGGFVGVDVFFVISGYLITTIIISEMSKGKFSIMNFYERRARRILPALFFVMLVCLPFAWFWLIPSDLRDFGQSLVAVSTFSSNILFWIEIGYFETAVELKPLLHTWSLAVEEQYYILFPVFLLLTWRLGLKWVLFLLVIIFVISLGVAHWGAYNTPSATFYLLPTRGWELVIGVFAAFYLKHNDYLKSNAINQALSMLGFGMIVYSIIAFDQTTPFPSLYALIPTIGTGLLILTAVPNTLIHKLLSLQPIVGVGLISYSAYLWHLPALAFARHRLLGELSDLLLIILCLSSFVMAYISWRWVEKPFRNKNLVNRQLIFSFSIMGILLFSLIGFSVHKNDGFDSRFNDEERRILEFMNYPRNSYYREGTCFLIPGQNFSDFTEDYGNGDVLIWGDSHGAALSVGLREIAKVSQYTSILCPPLLGVYISADKKMCIENNNFIVNEIKDNPPKIIILHSNWLEYKYDTLLSLKDTLIDLSEKAKESQIFVLGGVPQWHPSLPSFLLRNNQTLSNSNDVYLKNFELKEIISRDNLLSSVVNEISVDNIKFISALEKLCSGDHCLAIKSDDLHEPMAWDYGHLTLSGSQVLGNLISKDFGF